MKNTKLNNDLNYDLKFLYEVEKNEIFEGCHIAQLYDSVGNKVTRENINNHDHIYTLNLLALLLATNK